MALVVAVAGLGALAIAWFVQHRMQIVPCELCLLERWPWRVALVCGLLGAAFGGRPARAPLALAALAMVAGVVLGGLHVGVEQHLWPSPFPSCRAPDFVGGSLDAQLAALPDHPSKPCDAPTDLVPGLPVSMAAMDAIASVLVGAVIAIWFGRHGSAGRAG